MAQKKPSLILKIVLALVFIVGGITVAGGLFRFPITYRGLTRAAPGSVAYTNSIIDLVSFGLGVLMVLVAVYFWSKKVSGQAGGD